MSGVKEYIQNEGSILNDPERLLKEYLPLIRYHADQLMRRTPASIELNDMIDAGVLGLLDGAQRFDGEREVQFKTFVSYRVRGAMIDYLRAFDWMPRSLRDTSKSMQLAMSALEQEKGRPAEEDEVAAYLEIDVKEYRKRLDQVRSMSVLHFDDLPSVMGEDDEMSVLDMLEGDEGLMPDRQLASKQFIEKLAHAMERLPKRELVLLTLYYYEELTMKEVAMVLGLTESRISQLHGQMVVRLRGSLKLDEMK
ncbi:MAG: FliA/WhiG family RNA polymerase sigma factor [Mariprofundaceae bacterium]|nr:FliA/WhiG family RNA polymerase sigma factor [Mariprofundaceae bacterium]